MDDVAQTVQPVVYSGLQNYQCFYQFKIINCQKLSIFISILYQLKLSILKIINYLLSILYQFLYQSSSKIINISKLSILKIHNSGEWIRTPLCSALNSAEKILLPEVHSPQGVLDTL